MWLSHAPFAKQSSTLGASGMPSGKKSVKPKALAMEPPAPVTNAGRGGGGADAITAAKAAPMAAAVGEAAVGLTRSSCAADSNHGRQLWYPVWPWESAKETRPNQRSARYICACSAWSHAYRDGVCPDEFSFVGMAPARNSNETTRPLKRLLHGAVCWHKMCNGVFLAASSALGLAPKRSKSSTAGAHPLRAASWMGASCNLPVKRSPSTNPGFAPCCKSNSIIL
mmetsp:Transcript_76010/g.220791  ORF Transcript_76010/g.220791 Transcript_76010/m.220791 type:complete len:225 (-) Transcript_76010:1225-1899(-)